VKLADKGRKQMLLIIVGIIVAPITIFTIWMTVNIVRIRRRVAIGTGLVEHLRSIGLTAQHKEGGVGEMRWDETPFGNIERTRSEKLADIRVSVGGIRSIEVWRVVEYRRVREPQGGTRLQEIAVNEMTYIIDIATGMTVPASVQASTLTRRTILGKIKPFEWHAFPALLQSLEADKTLKHRLLVCLDRKDLPGNLSIKRLPSDRLGITTMYKPRRLPSRELLKCIEDIAAHVSNHVTEWNRDREAKTEEEPNNET